MVKGNGGEARADPPWIKMFYMDLGNATRVSIGSSLKIKGTVNGIDRTANVWHKVGCRQPRQCVSGIRSKVTLEHTSGPDCIPLK